MLGFGVQMEHVPLSTQGKIVFSDGVVLTYQRLYVILTTVVLLTALWLFLRKSKFGWALRACAQDREAAVLQGMSINATARLAMFIGAALPAAGALTAPLSRRPRKWGTPSSSPLYHHHRRRRRLSGRRRACGHPLCLREYLRHHDL